MPHQLDIVFEWQKCPHGYRFATEGEFLDNFLERFPPIANDAETAADPKDPRQIAFVRQAKMDLVRDHKIDLASSRPFEIVPNSNERTSYRPLDGSRSLIKTFAQVRTPEELLAFITRYGPLKSERGLGESIASGLNSARQFRDLLSSKSKGPKKVAAVFEARFRDKLVGEQQPSRPIQDIFSVRVGEINIVSDLSRGVRLELKTDSLLNAMWWELNQKIAGETIFRACRQCGKPFEAGPGGDARIDAKFCCPKCSVLFHSHKRSKGA